MIIVRVGLARQSDLVAPSGTRGTSFTGPRLGYGQQSLAVEITQYIETDAADCRDSGTAAVPLEFRSYADSKDEMVEMVEAIKA